MTDFITDAMVEKAARALFEQEWLPADLSQSGKEAQWRESREYFETSARAALTAALPLVIEECAKVIEDNQEVIEIGPNKNRRTVQPRIEGNLSGLAFARAIRSLLPTTTKET
jgi:hypothetical protein